MKKILLAVLVAVVAVAGLGWGLYAAMQARFQPVPEVPKLPAPKDRAEAMRQDLEVLALLPNYDRSFSTEAVMRFESERRKLLAAADTLTPAALEMQVSRLVALADNGHTTVGRRRLRLHRVPVRFGWFAEGLYVVRTTEAHAALLGAKVVSINGKSPEDLLAGLVPYVGGPPEHAKATSPMLMESPTALGGAWPAMSDSKLDLVARTAQGALVTTTLEASAPDPKAPYIDPTRNLAPQRLASEAQPWRNLLAATPDLPLALREPDASVFAQALDGGKGLYIHITQVSGDERGALAAQLDAILEEVPAGSLRYAILDLRFNGGGNYTTTLRFTKQLPKRVAADGKVFILSDHATFSAALVTLARAKYFSGERAVVLGERVGDRERFWAEAGAPLELPNSKILVFFATGYHDWNQGCGWKDLTRCFWLNWPFDVPAGDLGPTSSLPWKFSDYAMGVDTVLEEALRQARQP